MSSDLLQRIAKIIADNTDDQRIMECDLRAAKEIAAIVIEEAAKQPRLAWADGWGPKPPEDGAAEGALIMDCERRIRSLLGDMK